MHSCSTLFLSLCVTLDLIYSFDSVVCAVQVKVEEMEMETSIHPPENPRTVPLVSVKQEEGESTQTDPRWAPKQKAVQQDKVQGDEAPETTPEFGCTKQNMNGENSSAERSKVDQSFGDDCSSKDVTERMAE